ncbi:hypothetical protein J6590_044491 [Homalodisca vitripennis]|nr:hypothetical protein J6590_044491 [Homalodisca vitripennis]
MSVTHDQELEEREVLRLRLSNRKVTDSISGEARYIIENPCAASITVGREWRIIKCRLADSINETTVKTFTV